MPEPARRLLSPHIQAEDRGQSTTSSPFRPLSLDAQAGAFPSGMLPLFLYGFRLQPALRGACTRVSTYQALENLLLPRVGRVYCEEEIF